MPLILLIVLLPILMIALMPLILIQRYRVGSSRRMARPWMATVGLITLAISAVFFLITAFFTSIWVASAFAYAIEGIAIGCAIGAIGVLATKWESGPRALHYTPNRWLVLVMTLLVTARVVFGLYRSMMAAEAGLTGHDLIGAFGIAGSLGAGGIVLGYYLAYGAGLRWRIRKWQRRALRPM
ncbi:MAG: hypothetical protein ABI983_06030 [Acidobacteriota bacterium]